MTSLGMSPQLSQLKSAAASNSVNLGACRYKARGLWAKDSCTLAVSNIQAEAADRV